MKQSYFNLSLLYAAMAALPLVGCIDDNYDLTDIDTTVRVQVNDLEVPVNLDAITMSNIIDIDPEDDESVIKEIGDSYAVLVDGEFNSAGVYVNKVNLGTPSIQPVVETINIGDGGIDLPSFPSGLTALAFPITDISTPFEFSTESVDKSIKTITNIKADWNISLNLSFDDHSGLLGDMSVKALRLQLPNGLMTPDYENVDGVITLGDRTLVNGRLEENIRVSAIDFSGLDASEFEFVSDPEGDNPGKLSYKGAIGVKSGVLVASVSTSVNHPSSVTMTLDPRPAEIIIDKFSGELQYAVTGLDVSSVELNDLPDMLTQGETDIRMANPQLYLAINNPVADYGVDIHSGVVLTPMRDGVAGEPCTLPSGEEILIGHDKGVAGPYNVCLSPEIPADGYYQGFEGASHVSFPSLSDVLAGNGLPAKIDVDFAGARIGRGLVSDFELGITLPDVKGNYTFFAPLAFNAGSRIVYSEVADGWSDDTLDKMTIESVSVTAHVENNLPFDIVLSGYPVDKEGKQCVDPDTKQPVNLGSINIGAGKSGEINLKSTGTVVGIDGIRYTATGSVGEGDGGQTLRPSTTINLTNIRAKVSGWYEDKL